MTGNGRRARVFADLLPRDPGCSPSSGAYRLHGSRGSHTECHSACNKENKGGGQRLVETMIEFMMFMPRNEHQEQAAEAGLLMVAFEYHRSLCG